LSRAEHDASADWLHRHRARKNADAKAALLRQHEHQFATWAFELWEGFSLLMFGFGSKQASVDVTTMLVLPRWARSLSLWLCRLHVTAPPARFGLTDIILFKLPCIWRAGLAGPIGT